jgi:hypothetical protein
VRYIAIELARRLLPDKGVALRRGIRALELRLKSLPGLAKLPKNSDYEYLDGYRERDGDAFRCIIKCEAFNAIFASTYDRDLALDWLNEQRRITPALSKTATPGSSPKHKGQFIWPDKNRRRSYEIRWPLKRAKSGNAGRGDL